MAGKIFCLSLDRFYVLTRHTSSALNVLDLEPDLVEVISTLFYHLLFLSLHLGLHVVGNNSHFLQFLHSFHMATFKGRNCLIENMNFTANILHFIFRWKDFLVN